ncbi:hypothetical protein L6452_19790 [Arctium lappa]|uniref:Uncharacterized protein n=1 Tax=Arctium lappa TaxID=4217 RepID=A0ACB9BAC3_ARCLA|nr:hypothetical protein L6452_19790 [Arctium lappa]
MEVGGQGRKFLSISGLKPCGSAIDGKQEETLWQQRTPEVEESTSLVSEGEKTRSGYGRREGGSTGVETKGEEEAISAYKMIDPQRDKLAKEAR